MSSKENGDFVSCLAQITQVVNLAEATFGRINMLRNNVGVSYLTAVAEVKDARVLSKHHSRIFPNPM